MKPVERRKHERVETGNHILYRSMDDEGQIVSRSMAKAINISQSGIMLETSHPIETQFIFLMTGYLDNNLIEMTGRLIYCKEINAGMFQVGINFIGSEDETSMFAVKLIKLYHHKLIMQDAA
jgi:hypothetical protein